MSPLNPFDEEMQRLDEPDRPAGAPSVYDQALTAIDRMHPAAEPNPFDAAIDRIIQRQTVDMRAAQIHGRKTTPDRAAAVQRLGREMKLPPEMVERNFDDLARRRAIDTVPYEQMLSETPALARWATDAQHVAVAADDLPQLGAIERTLSFGGAILRGVDVAQGLAYAALEATGELVGASALTTLGRAGRERNVREAASYGPRTSVLALRGPGDLAQWIKETVGEQIPVMSPMLVGGVVGGAIGSVVPIVGTSIGATIGAAIPAFVMGVGEVQGDIKAIAPDTQAPAAVFIGGTAIAAFDTVLPGRIGSRLARTFGRETAEAIARRALLTPVAPKFLRSVAAGMATEGVTEAIQEAIGAVAVAKGTDTAVPADLWRQMVEAGAAGALLGGVSTGVETTVERRHLRAQIAAAQQSKAVLDGVAQGVKDSKLYQRLPEQMEDFIAAATKDGPVETVYAPVDTFTAYAQSKGFNPAILASTLTGHEDAYAEALRTGEDLAIPFSTYAVKVAPTDHHTFFANELRVGDPEAMNARESAAYAAQLAAEPATPTTPEAGAPTVREDAVTAFETAGVPRDVGEQAVRLSDRAITEAEAAGRITPLFQTPEAARAAGLTDAEYAMYRASLADTSRRAREDVDRQLLADLQREQTPESRAARAELQAAAQADLQRMPVYQALAAIQHGTRPDGTPLVEGVEPEPVRLSKAAIVQRYGEARLAALDPSLVTVAGGTDPEHLAGLFGFSSGDALLTALADAPPLATAIQQETDLRMFATHGGARVDGTLPTRARVAVASEPREDVIREETRVLSRRARQGARSGAARIQGALPPAAVLRAYAQSRIAQTTIRELRPSLFWAAARRAGQMALDAAARQDFDTAIVAKQAELVNVALYREGTRAVADVEARVAQARALGTTKSQQRLGLAGHTYLDQILGILDRYEFARVPPSELDKRARVRDWMEALEAQGQSVESLPQTVLDDARRVNWREVTVEELVSITDGLKQIVHLARLKNKLLKSADKREFQGVRDGLVASIREHTAAKRPPLEFGPTDEKWRRVAGWFAAQRKIAMLARALDGHVDGGPFWEAFIRPINAAADAKDTRNRTEGTAYHAILERHYPGRELGRMSEQLPIPAIGGSLSREARLAVALNQGTEGNRERLLVDPSRKWNAAQVAAILDTLDARDWQFVQDTWDFVDHFWPEIAAKHERITGLAPEKVEASPVETKFGTLRGGYYPLAYEPRLHLRPGQHDVASEATLARAASYVASTTRRGFLEERQRNVRLPLRLELGVMFAHVDQVIHDLTHHEMLIDVSRLLRDPGVSQAILDTKGDAVYRQFTTALEDIAMGSLADRNELDRAASWIRQRTQLAMLGWNLWTAAQQPLGLFNGAQRVGGKWVARGMRRWLRDAASLQNTVRWIAEVSPMMRGRAETLSPELRELQTRLREPGGWFDTLLRTVSANQVTREALLASYTWHIGLMQRVADVPTWLGQYEKSMAAGKNEATAIALADQAVLDSQGGGSIKDLASVQRGGGMARLFTMFYSYGNTVLNANINAAEAANFKSPLSVLTFLGHLALINIMPAAATVAMSVAVGKSRGGDDWEWWLKHIAGESVAGALNGLVLVREASAAVQIALHMDPGVRGYEGPAGTRLFQLLTDAAVQTEQGEADEAFAKSINQLAGVVFRYPALQVQRTVDGWRALEAGRTTNPAALLVGAPKAQR